MMEKIRNIAFGHINMDLDCLGSLILVKKLFTDYRLVKSNLIHPAARKVYNIYQQLFDFLDPAQLNDEPIEEVIIVDTCIEKQVKEYFNHFKHREPRIRIIDHHNLENCDIPGAQKEGLAVGSTVTCLGKMAMSQGVTLTPEEATIALTGLYADTGRLIYENVRREDFEVAGYLFDMGASLGLTKSFLESIVETDQIIVLNELIYHTMNEPLIDIHGHKILITRLSLRDNTNGLNAVVDKVMEIENPDAYFAFFSIPKNQTVLLIARSKKKKIDLHELFQAYGGGGHQAAASITMKNRDMQQFSEEFLAYLERSLKPATLARDIMTTDVLVIQETDTLMQASRFLEDHDLTGLPVVDSEGLVSGFLSLRDISKGRRAEQMKAPVKSHMTRKVITSHGYITMRQVEDMFYKNHINHIPIVDAGKRLLGMVTYTDYLRYKKNQGILT